jgi:uncharacterized membrane protein
MSTPQDPYGQQPYQQPQQPYQQPQQPYQQPYSAPPGGGPDKSSTGLDGNVAAGLGYIIPIVGIVFFFIEKGSRFVKFHAAQSLVLSIVGVVIVFVNIALGFVSAAVSVSDSTGVASGGFSLLACGITCVTSLLWLALVVFFIWGAILGFTGKYQKLPVVGEFAERLAGGPAAPAM